MASARQTSFRNHSISRRQLLAGSAATAAGLAAARLNPAAARPLAQEKITPGGTLTYGLNFDFDGHLDPQQTNFDSVIRVTLNICEPLVWMPTATKIVPGLADSWDISADGTEYTFHLKKGVKFHDGTPFNAEAVQFTFDRVVAADKVAAKGGTPDPKQVIVAGQSHDQIGTYDHSVIIDDSTIKMVLSRPFAPFLSGLNGYLGIVSPTAVQKKGIAGFDRAPVGTGPYVFKEWIEADHCTITRNPDYDWGSTFFAHQGAAYFDEIVYKIIPDNSVRSGTIASDETQYIDVVDPLQLQDIKDNPDAEVVQRAQPGSGYTVLINIARTKSPTADIKVRQALEYGLDKDAFNQSVYGGIFAPAASPLMKPTFAYDQATEKVYSYDKKKAEQLLDEAGWVKKGDIREKDGKKLELYFPIIDRPDDNAQATFLQGAYRAIGIDVKVDPQELAAARQTIRVDKNYDLTTMWFSYADPDVLRTIFYSKNKDAFNRAQYDNPEVDKMLEDAAASSDPDIRKDLYSKIQLKVLNDAVVVPLVDSITYNAKRKKLTDEHLDFLASYVWMNDAHFE